jgi:hypothetical protein
MKIAIDKLRESEIGRRIIELIGEEELYKYDPESLNSLHIDAVIKHSREQKEKLKIQYKKVDFLIRAHHEAEVSLIQKQSEDDVQRCERLIRMETDKKDFLQSIRGQRHEDYVTQSKDFDQRLKVARQQRLEQLRKENVEKKKQDWKKQKQLAKQQKIQAELDRVEAERVAIARVASDAKKKHLDEQFKKQRELEEKMDKKIQEQVRNTSTTTRRPVPHQEKEKDIIDKFVYSNF